MTALYGAFRNKPILKIKIGFQKLGFSTEISFEFKK